MMNMARTVRATYNHFFRLLNCVRMAINPSNRRSISSPTEPHIQWTSWIPKSAIRPGSSMRAVSRKRQERQENRRNYRINHHHLTHRDRVVHRPNILARRFSSLAIREGFIEPFRRDINFNPSALGRLAKKLCYRFTGYRGKRPPGYAGDERLVT